MGTRAISMSYRLKILRKKPPAGWDLLEDHFEESERKMKEAVEEPHEGKRKAECTWMIHKLHWERNRFIFQMYFQEKKIDKKMYDYLCQQKLADGPLIAKWRKPGYEFLCSLAAIDTRNTNYGTSSICRVPLHLRGDRPSPAVQTGCVSCASTDKGAPIWWCSRIGIGQAKRDREDEAEERAADVEDPEEDPEFAKRLKMLRGEDGDAAAAAPAEAAQ